mgnify:CR=1 FL=1
MRDGQTIERAMTLLSKTVLDASKPHIQREIYAAAGDAGNEIWWRLIDARPGGRVTKWFLGDPRIRKERDREA